jgi:DNA-binding transcriptional ArsR family regulator
MAKTTDGIQSLERGLEVLRLLAKHGKMSSSEIASELGIHQSSASRLLKSLRFAGLVRKPAFQSFAAGYGLLHLAGIAMDSFPVVAAAVKVCSELRTKTGCGAAAGTLWEDRILYFARIMLNPEVAPVLVERSEFPIKESALGLLLLHNLNIAEKTAGKSCEKKLTDKLEKTIARSLDKYGILYIENIYTNRFAAALNFEVDEIPSALVIHSYEKCITPVNAVEILQQARKELTALCPDHITFKPPQGD